MNRKQKKGKYIIKSEQLKAKDLMEYILQLILRRLKQDWKKAKKNEF